MSWSHAKRTAVGVEGAARPNSLHFVFIRRPGCKGKASGYAPAGVDRLNHRTSAAVAVILVAVGAFRAVCDTLHELNPNYWTPWAGHWLRYLLRAPTDGTILGMLNTQWFKTLAIPCGISLIYLRDRLVGPAGAAEFHDWAVRGVWIGVFLAGFTMVELEKQLHLLGMQAALLEGELASLNHVAHGLGAWIAWRLSGCLTFPPLASEG